MIVTLAYISGLLTPLNSIRLAVALTINTTALAEQDSVTGESTVTHHVHMWTKGF